MQRAYEIDSNNALVLNHMADQYFKKWYPVAASSMPALSSRGNASMLHVRVQFKSIVLETKYAVV